MSTRAFRPSSVFLGIVALFVVGGVMSWFGIGNAGVDVFLFVAAGWVVSLCLHEYAHALTGYHAGDRGVAARGYLTLNPLKYSHPLLSIVFPLVFLLLGGIGLPGGAVWVDRHAIRSRGWDSLISFAGPAVNVVCTGLLVVPFLVGMDTGAHRDFWAGVAFLAFLQLTASVLNLLPIPGVDGGNLIQPWLSPQWQRGFDLVAPYGLLVLVGLLWQVRLLNEIFFGGVAAIGSAIGLPGYLVSDGYHLFQFWS